MANEKMTEISPSTEVKNENSFYYLYFQIHIKYFQIFANSQETGYIHKNKK